MTVQAETEVHEFFDPDEALRHNLARLEMGRRIIFCTQSPAASVIEAIGNLAIVVGKCYPGRLFVLRTRITGEIEAELEMPWPPKRGAA